MEITYNGLPPIIDITPPKAELVAVKSKDGEIIKTPTSHKGKQLTDTTPHQVAKLYLAYIQAMVAEAETLV